MQKLEEKNNEEFNLLEKILLDVRFPIFMQEDPRKKIEEHWNQVRGFNTFLKVIKDSVIILAIFFSFITLPSKYLIEVAKETFKSDSDSDIKPFTMLSCSILPIGAYH